MDIDPPSSRRRFLRNTGTLGLAAAGLSAGLIPITTLAQQVRLTSLWPARMPEAGRGASIPSLAYRVYSKLAFGPRPANPANPGSVDDLTWFAGLGGSDNQRLQAWLNEQMNPDGSDPEVDSRVNGNPVWRTHDLSLEQLWDQHHRYDGPENYRMRNRPYWEMQMLAMTRMTHSRWQLREVLADFWHNHFNVDGGEDVVRSTLTSYDSEVIRPQIFGNFRVMLEGVVKHAAMMYYLDNRRNSSPNPNENYARELLELHTLGAVENYFGYVPTSEVPDNVDGQPAGYVEEDVLETARLLTGFGVADGDDSAPDTGAFLFRDDWHDDDPKTILGETYTYPGPGANEEQELTELLDYLSQHRGTAEYICWKLAVRLIGDGFTAQSNIVQTAATVFQNNWNQPDQLKQVYSTLILSGEFQNAWDDKVRRPLEIVVSALRAANAPFDFELNSADDNAGLYGFHGDLSRTGQLPFSCEPPTGYAEDASIWKGSGPLVMSWRAVSRMIRDTDSGATTNYVDFVSQTNAAGVTPTPNAIVDFWLNRIQGVGHSTAPNKRAEMVAFVRQYGQADGDDLPLDIGTTDTGINSTYQRVLNGLFLLIALLPERMIR